MSRVRDPNLPLLGYDVKHQLERNHHEVIADLLNALQRTGYEILNYDHIQTTIPKQDLPLKWRGKRYDILARKGSLIALLEVKATTPSQLIKRGQR